MSSGSGSTSWSQRINSGSGVHWDYVSEEISRKQADSMDTFVLSALGCGCEALSSLLDFPEIMNSNLKL